MSDTFANLLPIALKVVQEVFAARYVSVLCGPSEIPWREFCSASLLLMGIHALTKATFAIEPHDMRNPSNHGFVYLSFAQEDPAKFTTFQADRFLTAPLLRHLDIVQISQLEPFAQASAFLADLGLYDDDWNIDKRVRWRLRQRIPSSAEHSPVYCLLHALLQSSTYLLASDARDRIFALLGIAVHLAKVGYLSRQTMRDDGV